MLGLFASYDRLDDSDDTLCKTTKTTTTKVSPRTDSQSSDRLLGDQVTDQNLNMEKLAQNNLKTGAGVERHSLVALNWLRGHC